MVATPRGDARVTWYHARPHGRGGGRPRAVLALGHGAGGGVEARDLRALADALPAHAITVALVEQPWRVAGKRVAPAPKTLDAAWTALWPALERPGVPVVAGGRSAGARVACRTARDLGARAVLALAFPLHAPRRATGATGSAGAGSRGASRAAELGDAGLPLLVIQGTRDPFGVPEEFPRGTRLAAIPDADHGFAVPKTATSTQEAALAAVTEAATEWLTGLEL
ncbi:alpha/beta hydrolase family protein [Streptomyces sp. 4N509B]|uniref:alpha/beta hydrolase family protein n=1 Tax=Streptomyces sp. 4N509B TaxID=3457413 RepID=UPI003FCFDE83